MQVPTTLQAFSKIFLKIIIFVWAIVYVLSFTIFVLMIDEKKLKTVSNYAKKKGFHRNWIYQLIKSKSVKLVEIDGVKFVEDDGKK